MYQLWGSINCLKPNFLRYYCSSSCVLCVSYTQFRMLKFCFIVRKVLMLVPRSYQKITEKVFFNFIHKFQCSKLQSIWNVRKPVCTLGNSHKYFRTRFRESGVFSSFLDFVSWIFRKSKWNSVSQLVHLKSIYPFTQLAAVRTTWSEIIAHPQKWLWRESCKEHWYGHFPIGSSTDLLLGSN